VSPAAFRDDERAAITSLLETVVASRGLDLEALDITPVGRRQVLRVVVDRDGGIDLDEVAEVSRALSAALDESPVVTGGAAGGAGGLPYTLEVTSPGVDRPLTHPRHWRRNADRLVTVTRHDGEEITGRVLTAEEDAAVLTVDGAQQRLRYADIARATVQVEFRRPSSAEEAP
jgi:ribosome maturation factor RimP